MYEDFRTAGGQFTTGVRSLTQVQEVRNSFVSAILTLVMALILGRNKTGLQLRDTVDDFLTAQVAPLVGSMLAPLQGMLGMNAIQQTEMVGLLFGAFSGLGNQIAALVVPETVLADDGVSDSGILMRTALILAGIGIAVILAIPYIKDLVDQVTNQGAALSSAQSADALGVFTKAIVAYLIAGIVYCFYVRLHLADADADGLCTEEEYEAYFSTTGGTLAYAFGPVNAFMKLFVGVILPFDTVIVENEP